MPLFLPRHAADDPRIGVAVTHHRKLARIDARRPIFARLIDAKHGRGVGQGRCHGRFMVNHRITPAALRERIAFHPASDMPNMFHGMASQRTSGMAITCARTSAVRSEEHTSELQSLMRISYAVSCV